jgi:hypothetical protein
MDPIFELKKAVLDKLKATTAITDMTGTRIYDRIPPGSTPVPSPYISLGAVTSLDNSADCIIGKDITMQIDVYSWGIGLAASTAEATQLAYLVEKALRDDIELTVNALVLLQYRGTNVIVGGPDGVTTQAAITYLATTEEVD